VLKNVKPREVFFFTLGTVVFVKLLFLTPGDPSYIWIGVMFVFYGLIPAARADDARTMKQRIAQASHDLIDAALPSDKSSGIDEGKPATEESSG
jgi:hypothetical protein